jgi:type I restriction enzyme S subunit
MATNNNDKTLNVPPLRFPEFTEEWGKCKVSDLLDIYSTNSLSWEQLEYDTNAIMNLHYGLIHVGLPTMVNLTKDKLPNIKEGNMPKNFELCKEGDVAFADASEDTNEVAKTVEFFNLAGKDIVCGLHTIHGRDNKNRTVIGYKGYAFSSTAFHNQIRRIAQGTKIYSISSKNFSECYIGLPSKPEQTKIATLLRLIDERIVTQNKIIEKLQSLIKGIVVSHYSTTAHIIKVRIRELGEAYSTMVMSKEQLTNDGNLCVFYGELFTLYGCVIDEVKSRTSLEKVSSTLSHGRDLLFPASTTVDAVSLIAPSALMQKDIILGGDMFGIKVSEAYNPIYLSYYFNYIANKRLAKYAKGTTIIHLHYNEIANVAIELPNIEEQDKIVSTILEYSAKLSIEETILEKLFDLKQYLLKQLFI